MSAPLRALVRRLRPRPPEAPLVPVVYTMGKVGSTAVSAAIRAAGLGCHDIHTLEREGLKRVARDWLGRDRLPPRHICESMALRDTLMRDPARCLFITLVREPVARNLSAFFENLHLAPEGIRDSSDPDLLARRFLGRYPQDLPLTWLDRELRGEAGIDAYDVPFDPARGWVRQGNLILMRSDCPDAVKSRVLSEALGRRIGVGRANDSAAKPYRRLYCEVERRVAFPAETTRRLYGSRYARQFWSAEELAGFARRWTRPD